MNISIKYIMTTPSIVVVRSIALSAVSMLLAGCSGLLNQKPRDVITNDASLWNNANLVESYTNGFYENYIGYGQNSKLGWFYFKSLGDDQANPDFDNWSFTTVPSTSKEWTDKFAQIRRVNYLLDGLKTSTLPLAQKNQFEGIGRLNRAWLYYQLVREYGDIQWEDRVINNPDDPIVYGERTSRDQVMDYVLQDLDFAIAHIPTATSKFSWSKEMALAMKSDICLFEGTYCKYRTQADNGEAPNEDRAQKYLQECVSASETLIHSGMYSLMPTYGEVYHSLDLSNASEVIFARHYEKDAIGHSLVDYNVGSTTQRGLTKDAVDAFLFTDGKPLSTTSLPTDDRAQLNQQGNYSIQHLLAHKDQRLSAIIDSVICYNGHGWIRPEPSPDGKLTMEMTSSTGYTIRKYDTPAVLLYYRTNVKTGYTDAPLFWYAVIQLNLAEAKAELGIITQEDLDETINPLQHRVGLPAMTLNPEADPANNQGVSHLIWEIRRVRRCELMLDNWYRYWDLVRWHQLDKLDSNRYPAINRGANLTAAEHSQVKVDANGYMIATSATRSYLPKYYFYPIPTNDINLNGTIKQNIGWE